MEDASADRLSSGIAGSGYHIGSFRQSGFLCRLCSDRSSQIGDEPGLGQLVRTAVQAALLFTDGQISPVQGTKRCLPEKLVDHVFPCEFGCQIGGPGEELIGTLINLRLMVFDP